MKTKNKAFTLIELLVVIVIIGILTGIGIATYDGFKDSADTAKETAEARDACIQSIADCVVTGADNCPTFDSCGSGGTVEIDLGGGNIQVWSTANVNVGTRIDLATFNSQGQVLMSGQKVCYNDDPANCDLHGGLYDFSTAGGVCGTGFRLPTESEWDDMRNYLRTTYGNYASLIVANAVTKVGETTNADNALGMGLTLSGEASGTFTKLGQRGFYRMDIARTIDLKEYFANPDEAILQETSNKALGSVRCIQG